MIMLLVALMMVAAVYREFGPKNLQLKADKICMIRFMPAAEA
jgi:hypothetical protein